MVRRTFVPLNPKSNLVGDLPEVSQIQNRQALSIIEPASILNLHPFPNVLDKRIRFKDIVNVAPSMIWLAGPDGETLFVNQSLENFLGNSMAQNSALQLVRFIHSQDQLKFRNIFLEAKKNYSGFQVEYRILRRDGQYRWILSKGTPFFQQGGGLAGYVGSCTDITDYKLMELKLLRSSAYDNLTGLANRTLFIDEINAAYGRVSKENYGFAVLFIDLDKFKSINDTLGHGAGDRLLQIVARRLSFCVRQEDLVARLSGDEFTILLDNAKDLVEILDITQRILKHLSEPIEIEGLSVEISASIGIAMSNGARSAEEMLRNADTAMYFSKSKGRNRFEVFNNHMQTLISRHMEMEQDLRQAIRQMQFEIHYQPIIELKTKKITGVEALVRWQHPSRGLVDPGQFLKTAEETGLLVEIDQWVIESVCRQSKQWQNRGFGNINICVNLSGKLLSESTFVDYLLETLRQYDMDPSRFCLEIKERSMLEILEQTGDDFLDRIKRLGVSVAIDDFGSGYFSLSYLKKILVGHLKIDRFFVRESMVDEHSRAILQSMVSLAHKLDIQVTALGVETEEQVKHIIDCECDNAQGFLMHKPMDPDSLATLLENQMK
jgi:diguanylate cyclase (GGDEF)-like protein/PAS domain S-box-containing protein